MDCVMRSSLHHFPMFVSSENWLDFAKSHFSDWLKGIDYRYDTCGYRRNGDAVLTFDNGKDQIDVVVSLFALADNKKILLRPRLSSGH